MYATAISMSTDYAYRSLNARMLLLFYTVFLELIIRGSTAFQLPDEPRMYPQRSDVTVDAHSDLTLGCRGVEPMHWTFRDDVNGPYYNSTRIQINQTLNEKEVTLKYESVLTVYNVSHINIGFYYCYAEKADFNTARRSVRIYVFVRDENYLSVISTKETNLQIDWAGIIPCRPTSPDIIITLSCMSRWTVTVSPDNYTEAHKNKVSFHPHSGFQVENNPLVLEYYICKCVFARSNNVFTMNIKTKYKSFGFLYETLETIDGPNTANVGDDITLQCAILTVQNQYFPYYRHSFQWKTPNKRNTLIAVLQSLKLNRLIALNTTVTIKNVSMENEGEYTIYLGVRKLSKYVFINDKKTNSAPWIHHSNNGEMQVNTGENITLRCSGFRPVTWRVKDQKRTSHISTQLNLTTNQYDAYLNISAVRYTDTGFYYCHEKDSLSDHPFKSDKIYLFVKDERNLYLPLPYKLRTTHFSYTNVTVPCLPTSRDINVSLSLMYQRYDPAKDSLGPKQMIDSKIYHYDYRKGFAIQLPGPSNLIATCKFVSETETDVQDIDYKVRGNHLYDVLVNPYITGPSEDLVFVGQTLELSCAVLVLYNVPDNALRWTYSNNGSVNDIITKTKRISFNGGKVLVNTLIVDNVTISDKGRYSCHFNRATTNKFISVYDKFDFEPIITDLHYNVAYIGQPFTLQCNVSVDHNVDLPVLSWVPPFETPVPVKIMGTENITSMRSIHSQSILQIDNVTNNDGGNYTCSVSAFTNRKKHITTNIVVKRGVIPTIVRSNFDKEEKIDVLVGGTVDLACSAKGDPEPVITWMKDSIVISSRDAYTDFSSNNTQLTIRFAQRIDAGSYICIAQNPFGEDYRVVTLRVISDGISGWYIAFLIVMIILTATAAGLVTRNSYKDKKRRNALIKGEIIYFKAGKIQYFNPFLNVAEQATLSPYDTKWEIPRNKVELGRNLGSGCFGLVVQAIVSNFFEEEPKKTVAVKMLHPYSNFMDLKILLSELKIMIHLGEHDNLINLLGACTENIGEERLLIVLEYCRYGNLRNYLIENRCNFVNLIDPVTELICFPDADYNDSLQVDEVTHCSSSEPPQVQMVSTLQLLHWALQTARGMEFLAAKQILHGDLAARNVLLADNYVVKISDFGLSKTLISGYYKKKTQCPLPIKWMAIESIREKIFSTQSDVWAFGVVLWELFSLARIPYGELEPDLCFYRKLESGYRLECPEYSTRELYQVMRECWCEQPQCRPTFSSLVRTLTDLLQDPSMETCYTDNESRTAECAPPAARVLTADSVEWVALDILNTAENV